MNIEHWTLKFELWMKKAVFGEFLREKNSSCELDYKRISNVLN